MTALLRATLLLLLTGGLLLSDAEAQTLRSISSGTTAAGVDQTLNAGNKKKKKKASRTERQRTYTRRGNPNVTRRVATELLLEKLPELAALVDLEITREMPDTLVGTRMVDDSEDATASVPTAGAFERTSGVDYEDREMLDDEDPDQLSAEDEEYLEMTDAEMTIDAFYEDFTEYMRGLHGELHITDNGIDMIVAMESLMDWLGTRYLFGGTSSSGIDCSAFTRTMYRDCGVQLPRTAAMQWGAGGEAVERDALQFGDLVFFHTRKAVYVSHVGIYLGNGMFCHASSRNGVTISSLESNYYSTHYIGARRFDFTDRQGAPDTKTASVESDRTVESTDSEATTSLARR